MVVSGYVALKIQHPKILHYADWTNTRRKYYLNRVTSKTVLDLRRLFNGRTTILLVNRRKILSALQKVLGTVNTFKCIDVANTGSASKILSEFMSKRKKKKSYYNYQRDHWLSIISVVNIHLMLNREVPKSKILKIVERELVKYNRDITPQVLLEKFINLGLYIVLPKYISHTDGFYREEIVSIPDNKMDRTLG